MKLKRNILLSVVVAALIGCANRTPLEVPFVPGADTTNVFIYLDNDTDVVIMTGEVRRAVDKVNLEKHMREVEGYTNISNQITTR